MSSAELDPEPSEPRLDPPSPVMPITLLGNPILRIQMSRGDGVWETVVRSC